MYELEKRKQYINGSMFLFSFQHPVPCSPFRAVGCMQCPQIARSTFSALTEGYLNVLALRELGSSNCNIFFKIHIANLNAIHNYVKHFCKYVHKIHKNLKQI